MSHWQIVQQYIDTHHQVGSTFTSRDLAATLGITRQDASLYIQGHLIHQRGRKPAGKYVLKREVGTRTASAVWSVGDRVTDLRIIARGFSADTKRQWMRAAEPDIQRIAAINPAAARKAKNIISATFDGALKVLEAAVNT